MRVLLDTNVLVAAVTGKHMDHARAFAVLENVQNGKIEGIVSAHSLAEMYAVLTKSPVPLRLSPEQALLAIEENVVKFFEMSALTGNEYASLIREAATSQIQGGTIYDAILLKSAVKAKADRIYTFNLKHFEAMAPKDVDLKSP